MKLYFLFAIIVLLMFVFVYLVGVRDGKSKCNIKMSDNLMQQQSDLINLQRNLDAKVNLSATDDIRGVLRQKYTIAE